MTNPWRKRWCWWFCQLNGRSSKGNAKIYVRSPLWSKEASISSRAWSNRGCDACTKLRHIPHGGGSICAGSLVERPLCGTWRVLHYSEVEPPDLSSNILKLLCLVDIKNTTVHFAEKVSAVQIIIVLINRQTVISKPPNHLLLRHFSRRYLLSYPSTVSDIARLSRPGYFDLPLFLIRVVEVFVSKLSNQRVRKRIHSAVKVTGISRQ